MNLFNKAIFNSSVFNTGGVAAQPQLGGGAQGRGRRLTYGELMDLWENESRRVKALEAVEAREAENAPIVQKTTIKDTGPDKAAELRKQLAESRIRLSALEQERKSAEERAKISRMQAEALAREERAQKAIIEALEEEEAVAMTMIALLL